MSESAAEQVHRLLLARGETVATAESLTGGRLAVRFTDVPGISATYLGGVVTYATELKQSLLGVAPDVIAVHGVISAECAAAMAEGARASTGAAYALSTTGVAGPNTQEEKPPGTVFVAVAAPTTTRVVPLTLTGTRTEIQQQTCDAALAALADLLDPGESSGGR